jgi:tetratricopeptide (TPR) repeat protein
LEAFDRAIRLKKDYPAAHINRGVALQDLGRFDEALRSFDVAIALEPSAVAHMNRGLALRDLKRFPEAIQSLEYALELNPHLEEAKVNLGSGYAHYGRLEEALKLFSEVLRQNPRSVGALNNRGVALRDLGRYEEGLVSLNAALKVDGENIEALCNKGSLLNDLGRFEEAKVSFDKVLRRLSRHVAANWGKAISCLSVGDFEAGWSLYDYRIGYSKLGIFRPKTTIPEWNASTASQRLVICDEQGLGDTIFFASRLNEAHRLAAQLIVRLDERLVPLFSRSFPSVTAVSNSVEIETLQADSYLMLGSIFQALKSVDQNRDIAGIGSYLVAEEREVQRIRASLQVGQTLLCGLSWRSFRKGIGAEKSVGLLQLRSLLELPNVTFVNLQYGDVDHEIQVLLDRYGIRLWSIPGINLTSNIDSLAAVIKACDYVVSTSNSTAHFAGALGVRGTVLVPRGAGRLFYWNNRRAESSYWYPTLRLRDMSFGDNQVAIIEEVIADVREAAHEFAAR